MTRGQRVAKEARTWLGTPFRWQAAQKRVGCDCKGLLWGVARDLGFPEADSIYAKVADYSPKRPVDGRLLREGMAALFDPVERPRAGDVLLLRLGSNPSHLAIYSGPNRVIHAKIGGKSWVKETRLDALLTKFPLDSVWRWR